jgi:hypothetical protein
MGRVKAPAADDTLEFEVEGRTVRIATRPPDDDDLARLFEIGSGATWSDETPLTDDDVTAVVRGLIKKASHYREPLEIVGVSPAAALAFPDDPRISISRVEPLSFSLPGSPTGLVLEMDDRGNGHLWALGDERVKLGSDGMWWILTQLIDALQNPDTVATWPRFLVLGNSLGGSATQATLLNGDWGIGIVWRQLQSGIAGKVIAVQEWSPERAQGWVSMLVSLREDLERRRVHHQRLLPARTAEKWTRALERWSRAA